MSDLEIKLNWFDRVILMVAPKWGASRVRARLLARHFEAASPGRRTSGFTRRSMDANAAAGGAALSHIRGQARDLVRNNAWARRGLSRIETAVVGWGIKPKAKGQNADSVAARWKLWAETTQCDNAGRLNFYGLQALIMRTVVESGEVLVRRRRRRPEDGLAIPLQLQVLEPDHIDTSLDGIKGPSGGDIIQGVEFDMIGRRVAYWLFDQHPGARTFVNPTSRRIPASEIAHIFRQERAGQVRGVSWFAPVTLRLYNFDEFEDATLMKQKIAACMAAFVTDNAGTAPPLGAGSTSGGQQIDTFEPGMILHLPPDRQVTVANPPAATDHQSFSKTELRGIAAGLGVTYEDLTGDYSEVNYSSARMARNAFIADVHHWRWNTIIPQFCDVAWSWMIEALAFVDVMTDAVAKWTPPPVQLLDPDKEGQATTRAIRSGQMTPDEMVREQGFDPDEHWAEYKASLERLDRLGIVLDSDPRKMTQGGQAQAPDKPGPAPALEEQIKDAEERARASERRAAEAERRNAEAIAVAAGERERLREQHALDLCRQYERHENALEAEREQHALELERMHKQHAGALEAEREQHALELERMHKQHAGALEAERERAESRVAEIREKAFAAQDDQHEEFNRVLETQIAREREERARERADSAALVARLDREIARRDEEILALVRAIRPANVVADTPPA